MGAFCPINLFKVDAVLLDIDWELTMIPSLLLGINFPIILIVKFLENKFKP
jgi:hypothetical protein|tara:strand:+ start:161 stop:313 length:153 start_codon:yes stop_codon:yes gene_type:complete